MSGFRTVRLAMIYLGLLLPAAEAMAANQPQRIVSLNLCADQLVLLLADPRHVKSVTWLARNPDVSGVAKLARNVPVNYGLAEEVVPLAPDLVVAGAYTTRTTVGLLKRLGIPVLDLDVPQSIAAMLAQVRSVAQALGEARRGEQLITRMNAQMAALPQKNTGSRPVAAVWQPNGSYAGPGTLIDEVLHRAGFDNLAARPGLGQYDQLPLEALILGQPDVLILNSDSEKLPSLAQELIQHPVVKAAFPAARTVVVPDYLWACGGPGVIDALTILNRAAQDLARTKRQH